MRGNIDKLKNNSLKNFKSTSKAVGKCCEFLVPYIRDIFDISDTIKNPEIYLIDHKIIGDFVADRKTKKVTNYIRNAFNDKYKKGKQLYKLKKSFIVIHIDKSEIMEAARRINGEFINLKTTHKVMVIISNDVIELHQGMKYKEIVDKMTKASK